MSDVSAPQDPAALRLALGDLVHRYAALADQRRTSDLAELFAEDGELVVPTPPERLEPHLELRGRAAIAEHLSVLAGLMLTSHQLVGEVYDALDDNRAVGRVACVAHHLDGERDVVWHLHYDDTYVRESGVWRIRRRELRLDFIHTQRISAHR
ncbi:nuclear transport factor 2 family protein [Nocardioides sp. W7]|uniref:nuclear transport factor 2 family protein n=1 Tax=Nocardioides sp. W7 TaxID=2931390 RepID=UPI001FD29090|nr:nuclear transport factor 2 family protein [Nocardioides sp. W7]